MWKSISLKFIINTVCDGSTCLFIVLDVMIKIFNFVINHHHRIVLLWMFKRFFLNIYSFRKKHREYNKFKLGIISQSRNYEYEKNERQDRFLRINYFSLTSIELLLVKTSECFLMCMSVFNICGGPIRHVQIFESFT